LACASRPRTSRGRFCRAFAVLILASCTPALAGDGGIYLPPPPTGPGGEDSITTSEGVRCSQSINASGGYLDLGVAVGNLSTYDDPALLSSGGQSAIGYARIVIPLGRTPKRIDCTALYDLEIQRLKQEIQMLKIGLQ
jgi:hypothetical protein